MLKLIFTAKCACECLFFWHVIIISVLSLKKCASAKSYWNCVRPERIRLGTLCCIPHVTSVLFLANSAITLQNSGVCDLGLTVLDFRTLVSIF